jgi:RNA-directed DNA polymerase
MIPKVLIPERAIKRFCHNIRRTLAPNSTNESAKAKIIAINRLVRGWCEYYRCTNSPGVVFNQLRPEIFWGMAHWLGRKYKLSMPAVMRKYREVNTFKYKSATLIMPNEYKAKRFVARTWHNPYTEKDKIIEEKDRIKRENLLRYDEIWIGNENRHGWMDLREEVLLRDGPMCANCKQTYHPYEVQVDHITPRAKFKEPTDADRLENLQVLCTDCHRAKTKTDWKVLSRMR